MMFRYLKYAVHIIGLALIIHFLTLFISTLFTHSHYERAIIYPYNSDGCTWYVDGDYSDCCEVHDRAYWQ
jgi:hypothetical protein